jgi:hypothetical protein
MARTILVIVGPPIFAFLVPLIAPVIGSVVAWLRSVTLVWALLAGVIAWTRRWVTGSPRCETCSVCCATRPRPRPM